jgi:hypothetical protein
VCFIFICESRTVKPVEIALRREGAKREKDGGDKFN